MFAYFDIVNGLAVPFSEDLLNLGSRLSIAINLYKEGVITIGKAAKISRIPLEAFIEKLGNLNIPAVKYKPADLDKEIKDFE